jgi:hypothetical protein
MKRNRSESGTKNLADELAELCGVDPCALKQRWRALYRCEAPVRIGRALFFRAVAYRLQERVLGGLKPSTRPCSSGPRKTRSTGDRRPRPATKVTPGSGLIREWHGVSPE